MGREKHFVDDDDRRRDRSKANQETTRDNKMPFDLISGKFIPEKSNIWRDCVDGYYDWVKEHIAEGAPLNEADHCGDPPLLLEAGSDKQVRNKQEKLPIDLCQACWSNSYKYCREI